MDIRVKDALENVLLYWFSDIYNQNKFDSFATLGVDTNT